MEEVLVCRICLIMDVKMYDAKSFPLATYYEVLAGSSPLTAELPQYICYECGTLLCKFHNFYERCLLGQSVLYGILQTSGQITKEEIKQLNREDLNLTSRLKTHLISEESYIITNHDAIECRIKFEPEDEDTLVDSEFGKDGGFQLDCLSSEDDDKPLVLHKEKKAKKMKKANWTKETVSEDVQPANIEDLKPELIKDLETVEAPKRKRGRPRKISADAATRPKTETATRAQKRQTKQAQARRSTNKSRSTNNTGGVDDNHVDWEECVTVIKLSLEEQIEEINNRKQSSNYLNAAFQCNLCYKGFIDATAWQNHVGKHDPSVGCEQCVVCKLRFPSRRALQKHAVNHEWKFACKACPNVARTMTQAKQHQRWHNGVTYKCQYCDEVLMKWTSYLSHVRMKHPSTHVCGACGYSFVSALGLTMHRTMMHKDIAEKSESVDKSVSGPHCAACDVSFVSDEAFRRHMVTSVRHSQSNDYRTGCRACGQTFASPEELRLHHRREHARRRPRNYGKKPARRAWPAPCTHGNAFLVYHKRTHFEERAYKCAQCPKAFFNRTNLQLHEKTHSDARPYPCDVCYKAFKGKGALDRHYRTHTGVRPYVCEVCGKAFGQSNSRKLHVYTVHLKQPAPYVSRARQERRHAAPIAPTAATPAPPPPAPAATTWT